MSMRARDRGTVAIREEVILGTLRRSPWISTRMLSTAILEETGGAPAIATGALYIPPWTVYEYLRRAELAGKVERRQFSARTILWAAK